MLTIEQLQARRQGIGGSDAAALCGLSKWKTPLDVYQEKLGFREEAEEINDILFFGSILEPIVADVYAQRTGHKLRMANQMLQSKKYPWMLANIDRRIVGHDKILECKTTNIYSLQEWGEPYTDEMPRQYLLQCAHYAIVCNVQSVDLAVLIGGNTFRIYTYKRNQKLEERLIEKERAFWHEHVLARNPPNAANYREASKLWPLSQQGKKLEADANALVIVDQIKLRQESIKKLEEELDHYKTNLAVILQDSETLVDSNGTPLLTFKTMISKRLDSKKLQQEHKALYEQYCYESTSRTLRIKGEKSS